MLYFPKLHESSFSDVSKTVFDHITVIFTHLDFVYSLLSSKGAETSIKVLTLGQLFALKRLPSFQITLVDC